MRENNLAPSIVLDISRLISRVLHATPTGVDRVEMAYARGLLDTAPDRLSFAAVHPSGLYGRMRTSDVIRFLDSTERRWEKVDHVSKISLYQSAVSMLTMLRPRRLPSTTDRRVVYVQSSPHHLIRPSLVGQILTRESARFICLIHDLIPIQYPEYARPDGAAQHLCRMETIARFASGIIANSGDTLNAMIPFLASSGRTISARVALLGTRSPITVPSSANAEGKRPYFVCVGTIEPRKNHLLLLNIWRRLSERYDASNIPKLIIIGRRGWENEQVIDMLERCPALRDCVEEYGGLSDNAADAIIAGARALLLPSFAEGFGMPVTEALALNVPVLCSDLPALREAGGDVPEYLDPLDGPAWVDAVLDFAGPDSVRHANQLFRLTSWRPTSWKAHMDILHELIGQVVA